MQNGKDPVFLAWLHVVRKTCLLIIDGGSTRILVPTDFVKRLGIKKSSIQKTRDRELNTEPYKLKDGS